MKMSSLGWALIQYSWCPYSMKRGNLETNMNVGRMQCDKRQKWNDAPMSQETSKVVGKSLEARNMHGTDFPHSP